MLRRWGTLVLLAALAPGCSDSDTRAEPKVGKQVVVAKFDPEFVARGVAVDGNGTVYTTGWNGKGFAVTAFPKEGKPTRLFSGCTMTEGRTSLAKFALAAAPDGTLFWAMDIQYRIVRVTPDGRGDCFAGSGNFGSDGDGGPALRAHVDRPRYPAYDAERGDLYFVEYSTGAVRRVDSAGVITTAVKPSGTADPRSVRKLTFDQRRGRLYMLQNVGVAYRNRDGTGDLIPNTDKDELDFGALASDPTGGDLVATRGIIRCDLVRISDSGDVRPIQGGTLSGCTDQLAIDGAGDIWAVTDDQLVVIRPAP